MVPFLQNKESLGEDARNVLGLIGMRNFVCEANSGSDESSLYLTHD